MKSTNGFYSLVEYSSLPGADQAVVIGVVLLSSPLHFTGALFTAEGRQIVKDQIENRLSDRNRSKRSVGYEHHFAGAVAAFRNLSQLKEFFAKLGSEVRLTNPARVEVDNPLTAMATLLTQSIVSQRVGHGAAMNTGSVLPLVS